MYKFNNLNKKELYKISGIYMICIAEHKYVGSSKNLYNRLLEHKRDLINKKHSNDFLQNSINKYGIENASISILEKCNVDLLIQRESFWIKKIKSDMNLQDPITHTLSERSKDKLAKSMKKARKEGKLDNKKWNEPIQEFDIWGNFIQEYSNLKEACEKLNISEKTLKQYASGYRKGKCYKGRRYRYKNSKVPILIQQDMTKCACYFDFYYKKPDGSLEKAFTDARDIYQFINKILRTNPKEITIVPKLKDVTTIQFTSRKKTKACESGNVLNEEDPNPSVIEI